MGYTYKPGAFGPEKIDDGNQGPPKKTALQEAGPTGMGGYSDAYFKEKNDPSHGALPEYTQDGFKMPSAVKPAESQGLKNTFERQLGQAKDYRDNFNQKSDELYNSYATGARRNLADSIKKTRKEYNARGLLNSGARADAEQKDVYNANKQLDTARQQINAGLLGNIGQMEGGAFNTASLMAQPGPSYANAYLSGLQGNIGRQFQNDQLISGALGGALGGAGALGGLGLAQLMQQQNNTLGGWNPMSADNPNPTNYYGQPTNIGWGT